MLHVEAFDLVGFDTRLLEYLAVLRINLERAHVFVLLSLQELGADGASAQGQLVGAFPYEATRGKVELVELRLGLLHIVGLGLASEVRAELLVGGLLLRVLFSQVGDGGLVDPAKAILIFVF